MYINVSILFYDDLCIFYKIFYSECNKYWFSFWNLKPVCLDLNHFIDEADHTKTWPVC